MHLPSDCGPQAPLASADQKGLKGGRHAVVRWHHVKTVLSTGLRKAANHCLQTACYQQPHRRSPWSVVDVTASPQACSRVSPSSASLASHLSPALITHTWHMTHQCFAWAVQMLHVLHAWPMLEDCTECFSTISMGSHCSWGTSDIGWCYLEFQ